VENKDKTYPYGHGGFDLDEDKNEPRCMSWKGEDFEPDTIKEEGRVYEAIRSIDPVTYYVYVDINRPTHVYVYRRPSKTDQWIAVRYRGRGSVSYRKGSDAYEHLNNMLEAHNL